MTASNRRYLHTGRRHTHVVVWEEAHGLIPPGFMVDHINGDTHDNRLENLRLATRAQNGANSALSKRNSSGLKGLRWNPIYQSWRGSITKDGKTFSKNGDLLTVCAWLFRNRLALHGEFARHQ